MLNLQRNIQLQLKKTLLTVFSAVALAACTDPASPVTTLEAPVFVANSSDTTAYETGIRAWPGSTANPERGIRLEWYKTGANLVGGFFIYRTSTLDDGGQPKDFLKIATVEYGQTDEDTAYIDRNAAVNTRYFYKVSAYERSDSKLESAHSDVAEFTLMSALAGQSPENGAKIKEGMPVTFRWSVANGSTGYSVIRVFEANPVNNALLKPVWVYAAYPPFSDPSFAYNSDGKALPLEKGKTYRWYVTQIVPGQRNQASASRPHGFEIE